MLTVHELRRFLVITGAVLIALGSVYLVGGATLHALDGPGVPGTDSDIRYAGGALVGLGLIWIHSAREARIPTTLVRLLAGGLLLGGVARLLSWALAGAPGTVTLIQTGVEIAIPLVVLTLLTTSHQAARREP